MFVIINDCTLGVGAEPTGGFILKISNIPALPNIELGVTVGKESAEAMMKAVSKAMGAHVLTATMDDLRRTTSGPQ